MDISPSLCSSLLHHRRLELPWSPPKPTDTSTFDPTFEIDALLDFPPCDDDASSLDSPSPSENPNPNPKSSENPKICPSSDPNPDDGASNAGLCAPPDELVVELEWLSAFNEDSSYSGDTELASLVSSGSLGGGKDMEELPLISTEKTIDSFYITSPVSVLEQISTNSYVFTHFDRPKRSRRSRIGGRIWSLDILKPVPMTSKHKDAFEATFAFMSSNNESFNSSFLHNEDEMMDTPPSKKLRRVSSNMIEDSAMIRRCSHCLVQKTPQWRAGPLGPKTLCNACGVRYKSGRLLPEYRPACSPTFISEVHSNSHRRILEMRRAREIEVHHGSGGSSGGELHNEMQESSGDYSSHNELHETTGDAQNSGKVHGDTMEAHSAKVLDNDTMEAAHSGKVLKNNTMEAAHSGKVLDNNTHSRKSHNSDIDAHGDHQNSTMVVSTTMDMESQYNDDDDDDEDDDDDNDEDDNNDDDDDDDDDDDNILRFRNDAMPEEFPPSFRITTTKGRTCDEYASCQESDQCSEEPRY